MSRSSRAPWLAVLGVAAVLAGVFGAPALLDERSLFRARWWDNAPSMWGPASSAALVHEILAAGELPLWNPRSALGAPLAVELPSVYTPFHWPAFARPTVRAWEWIFAARFLVAGVGTLLLLRSLSVRSWVAFAYACLYMLSGHQLSFGNAWHMNTLCLAPFLLLGMRLLEQQRWRSGGAVVASSWGLMVVGSGLLDLVMTTLLAGLVVGARGVLGWRDGVRGRALYGAPLALAISTLIGLGLTGLFLIPFLELRSLAVEPWEGRAAVYFNSYAYGLSLFFHKLTLTPEDASHHFMRLRQHLSLLVAFGALVGWFGLRHASREQLPWFVAGWLLVGLHLGRLYGLVPAASIEVVPLLREVRFEKYLGLAYLALHLVAALGVEWSLRRDARTSAFPELGVGAILAVLPAAYATAWYPAGSTTLADVLGVACVYGALVAGFAVGVAMLRRTEWSALRVSLVALAIAAAVAELPPDFMRERLAIAPENASYAWLAERSNTGSPVRIFDATGVPPNRLLPYGLHDVRYYSDSLLPRYREVMRDHALRGEVVNPISVMSASHYPDFDHQILSALGVGYYVVPYGTPLAPGHAYTQDPAVRHDPDHAARAYLVYDAHFGVPASEVLEQLTRDPGSLRRVGRVEQGRPAGFPELPGSRVPHQVEVSAYGFNRVVLDVASDAPALLILLDQFYPGWQVRVNGREAPILRVNYLFRGVAIDAGESHVEFEYAPASFRTGLALSAASGLLLAAWLGLAPRWLEETT